MGLTVTSFLWWSINELKRAVHSILMDFDKKKTCFKNPGAGLFTYLKTSRAILNFIQNLTGRRCTLFIYGERDSFNFYS